MPEVNPDGYLELSVEDRRKADYMVLYNISQKLSAIVTSSATTATNSQNLTQLPTINQRVNQILTILQNPQS